MSVHSKVSRRKVLQGTGAVMAGASVLPYVLSPNVALAAQGNLRVAITPNPTDFSPANQGNHDAMAFTQIMFENLCEVDTDGNVQPALSTDWKVSDDGLAWTFNLRDDVKFQNGEKFTAEDVKYSYDHMLNQDSKYMGRRWIFAPIKNVVVESPTRVRFEMKQPFWAWLTFMSKYMGVFQKGAVEKHGPDIWKAPIGIGTGAGTFKERKPNDYVEYTRNPHYWKKGVPAWNTLRIQTVPEDATRVAFLLTKQTDIIVAPPPREFTRLKAFPGITGDAKPSQGELDIFMNNRVPPMDDADFRRAISQAIDRNKIKDLQEGLFAPFAVLNGFPHWPKSEEAERLMDFDLEAAKANLKKSKYPNGAEFDLVIPSVPYLVSVTEVALLVQAELAKIGIKANIRTLDIGQFWGFIGSADMTNTLQVGMTPPNPIYRWASGMMSTSFIGKNVAHNPQLDAMINLAYESSSEDEMWATHKKMQMNHAENAIIVTLGGAYGANLWRDSVSGFKVNMGISMRTRDANAG